VARATTVRDDQRHDRHRTDPLALARASAARLAELSGTPFNAGIVLGSGWPAAADALGTPEREITVAELHLYEGHEAGTVVHGCGPPSRPAPGRSS
jgi:hypothetical protein